ncbi:MAG: 50S ribosomal protein L9 [Dehalococcoidia bacterium]
MKVVFVQDVPNVAHAGEVKNVADGHARNYLFPKGFAVLATSEELKRVEAMKRAAAKLRAQQVNEDQTFAKGLNGVSLVFAKRVGSKGHIYGSVSSIAITQELKRLGHAIEKTMVKLEEPLKQLGVHEVEIEVAKGAVAKIKVTIEAAAEGQHAEGSAEESAEKPSEE